MTSVINFQNGVTVNVRQNLSKFESLLRSEVKQLTEELNGLQSYKVTLPNGKTKTIVKTVPMPDAIRAEQITERLTRMFLANDPKAVAIPLSFTFKADNEADIRNAIIKTLMDATRLKQQGLMIAQSVDFSRRIVLEVNGKFINLGRLTKDCNWFHVRDAISNLLKADKSLDLTSPEGLAYLSTGIHLTGEDKELQDKVANLLKLSGDARAKAISEAKSEELLKTTTAAIIAEPLKEDAK